MTVCPGWKKWYLSFNWALVVMWWGVNFEEFEGGAGFEVLDFCFAGEAVAALAGDPALGGGRGAAAEEQREEGEAGEGEESGKASAHRGHGRGRKCGEICCGADHDKA